MEGPDPMGVGPFVWLWPLLRLKDPDVLAYYN
jgi:hypothetical protein